MKKIIIIGAGAIGRGYLPWVFKDEQVEFVFVDVNEEIISQMNKNGKYNTYCVINNSLEKLEVKIDQAILFKDFEIKNFNDIHCVFINVGPRNVQKVSAKLTGTKCPIILCENDPDSVNQSKNIINSDQIYFAVPDVITSNTAPTEILANDPLAIITENGELFIDDRASSISGSIKFIPEKELINVQWTAKLYLHNTPHCIAAYLGALARMKYIHEAMAIKEIETVVQGSMEEMLNSLKLKWDIPHSFLEWYANKELKRFSCTLLFDPIARVAREPLRKLEPDGRLMGAAQICLSLGFIPSNILLGIASALLFDDPHDNDNHLSFMRASLSPTAFLTHVLALREGEALEQVLKSQLESSISKLNVLVDHSQRRLL
ncbi:MAG: hypothetical protein KDD45_07000 [Bdellovibrionales bacterium]|nr:hypothetical protein [Bdellovibrionales bacterium]